MILAIFILNAVVSSASMIGALIALARPQSISNSSTVTDGEQFYSWMYVARAIPLGALLGILPFVTQGRLSAVVLCIGAIVQMLDAIIGAVRRKNGMIFGPAAATIVHLICGIALWR